VKAPHAGEISRKAAVAPVDRPPLVVSAMSRPTYSTTARVAVVRVDQGVAAVAAERRDHLLGAGQEQRLAVVLQAAPDGVAVGHAPEAGVVVLQRAQRGVAVGPALRMAQGPAVDATVVSDVDAPAADGDRVLVGVRGLGAARRVGREAREREVPVRARRGERLAAVGGLEDLLEADVHVAGIGRIDRQELVVPGLHARAVARLVLERRARRRQLGLVGDQLVRAARRAVAGHEDAREVRVAGLRVGRQELGRRLDERVEPRAIRGVGEGRAADVVGVDPGNVELLPRPRLTGRARVVEAVVIGALPPADVGQNAAAWIPGRTTTSLTNVVPNGPTPGRRTRVQLDVRSPARRLYSP